MATLNQLNDPYAIRTPTDSPPPYKYTPPSDTRVDPKLLLNSSRVFVICTPGQSNNANMALGYQYVVHNVGKVLTLNVFDGQLYHYKEPLIGATGTGGHWIGNAADRLIDAELYDYVVVVPAAAVGGASVEFFAPGQHGSLRHRIYTCSQRVKELGLQVSCYNFGLGESATGYLEHQFKTPLQAMIDDVRSNGWNAPWIMDITTYHNGTINYGAVAALQNITNGTDILGGVNTDTLTKETGHRLNEDGAWVHLNQIGCEAKALQKFNNIVALKDYLPNGIPG